ncbi:CYTH domain-containing protein [Lonepinella sp. BR2271]|uniref:CYTH domain-containing protein n=1 Tax=Lonepinella sp. BR2271 TaxID=3434550 RepID=UPI003F6DFA7A
MSNEIELKLAVTAEIAEQFSQLLSDFRLLQQAQIFLANTYYDTADHYFARHKMGLRVRSENQQFTQTLKTNGKVTGGLHVRPEYNFPLDSAEPNVTLLQDIANLSLPEPLELHPIFSTDFTRQWWLIECGQHTEIEVALDRGEIKANGQIEPICEIEFELKNGALADLFTFVANLSFVNGVRLSSLSKAKRGYQLAQGKCPPPRDWIDAWRDFLHTEQTAENPAQILTALLAYEQQLIEETLQLGSSFFAQTFIQTVERIGAFFNLYHYYTDHGYLLQQVLAQQETDYVDESIVLEVIDAHQYLFAQIRQIIQLHSESKDNALAMKKLNELFFQGQYLKRMLALISMVN